MKKGTFPNIKDLIFESKLNISLEDMTKFIETYFLAIIYSHKEKTVEVKVEKKALELASIGDKTLCLFSKNDDITILTTEQTIFTNDKNLQKEEIIWKRYVYESKKNMYSDKKTILLKNNEGEVLIEVEPCKEEYFE